MLLGDGRISTVFWNNRTSGIGMDWFWDRMLEHRTVRDWVGIGLYGWAGWMERCILRDLTLVVVLLHVLRGTGVVGAYDL